MSEHVPPTAPHSLPRPGEASARDSTPLLCLPPGQRSQADDSRGHRRTAEGVRVAPGPRCQNAGGNSPALGICGCGTGGIVRPSGPGMTVSRKGDCYRLEPPPGLSLGNGELPLLMTSEDLIPQSLGRGIDIPYWQMRPPSFPGATLSS